MVCIYSISQISFDILSIRINICILWSTIIYEGILFSSPESNAQVSYCHSTPSVVVRPSVNFHIFNFFSRTTWWILMKLGRDEVLIVPYKCCCFSARSLKGRTQGGAKIGHRGVPFFKKLPSSDWKATATNQMHSNDLEECGKKCCYVWFHSEVKFLTRFDVFLDLVIFPYFNAIFLILMQFL